VRQKSGKQFGVYGAREETQRMGASGRGLFRSTGDRTPSRLARTRSASGHAHPISVSVDRRLPNNASTERSYTHERDSCIRQNEARFTSRWLIGREVDGDSGFWVIADYANAANVFNATDFKNRIRVDFKTPNTKKYVLTSVSLCATMSYWE